MTRETLVAMPVSEMNVVIGALGYTGRYIAARLLSSGKRVRTLTGDTNRQNPFGVQVGVAPLTFGNHGEMVKSMRGATTLYNTYWVRFERGPVTFARAVERSRELVRAAEEAGIRRIVHVSIANASEDSPLPYFRGKGAVERIIRESRLSYAIVRPTVIFGREDVLVNNIAWMLRKFPFFAIPGQGDYRVQPVFVEDVARIAVEAGRKEESLVVDAAGPETFTFEELVRRLAERVRHRARIVHLSPGLALGLARLIGLGVGDVVLTADEIQGLMAGLLVSGAPPAGTTRFSDWMAHNADRIGLRYVSELQRHYTRPNHMNHS